MGVRRSQSLALPWPEGGEVSALVDFTEIPAPVARGDSPKVCAKRSLGSLYVIPAKAGIQVFRRFLDVGFRRGDAKKDLLDTL
jgi:hypothetical protein